MNIKRLLGCKVNIGNFEEAFEEFKNLLNEGISAQIITINPEMITLSRNDLDFKKIIEEAELVIPDGIGVTLGLRFQGTLQERIPGVEFSEKCIEYCSKNSLPVALVGSTEEVIQKAKENLIKKYPELNITYIHNGFFDNDEEILQSLKTLQPRLLLVGLGSPKQEKLIYNYKKELKSIIMIGVGGSLDVYSGIVKRAPIIFQKLGLEWFYRLIKEPQRFNRIFPTIPLFLLRVITNKKEK